jgi:hypothetical protein
MLLKIPTGDDASKKGGLCLRFAVAVDMRPSPGIQVSTEKYVFLLLFL